MKGYEWYCGRQIVIHDPSKGRRCPRCGDWLEIEEDEDCQLDTELAATWGVSGDAVWDSEQPGFRFMYIYRLEMCFAGGKREDIDDFCSHSTYITPRRYWNAETQHFDLPRPLTPVERARQERAELLKAGQLELISRRDER